VLIRNLAIGSLKHFLAGVVGPVVVVGAAGLVYHKHPVELRFVAFGMGYALLVWGATFLWHEIILLVALPVLRRWFSGLTRRQAAQKLFNVALSLDLVLVCLLLVVPKAHGYEPRDVLGCAIFVLPPALYGVSLLACAACAAGPWAQPIPAGEQLVAPSDGFGAPRPPPGRLALEGLRWYVTAGVAVVAFAAVGWHPKDWAVELVAVGISFGAGHLAVAAARKWRGE
jgi:hypothetical protein